ncbi:unnamed protein product, partial [Mesorhabditis belari]|uniref:Uncharacterized protein n=1 Tax=Mesorhabditis belari TaxID=2138241 RepID=A0AAF3FBQ5_9BILA
MGKYRTESNAESGYKMPKEKEVSTRLLRPTLPQIDIDQVLSVVEHWDSAWENDASIRIFDEGIAQYMLVDPESHLKFFAALVLSKPSLRCTIIDEEPEDELDNEAGNTFTLFMRHSPNADGFKRIEYLKQTLQKRGYRFDH